MLLPEMGSVVASLPSLGISEDLATELRNYLETTAGELTDTTPDPVSGRRVRAARPRASSA